MFHKNPFWHGFNDMRTLRCLLRGENIMLASTSEESARKETQRLARVARFAHELGLLTDEEIGILEGRPE